MAVRVTRSQLVDEILDEQGFLVDREIAARSLVRNFPGRVRNLPDLIKVVLPDGGLTVELFDLLADAWENVHPRGET
jgi:hypothetical protein